MRVIIVEDEINVAELIVKMLKVLDGAIEVVGVVTEVKEAIELINNTSFDLAIMDIKIKGGTSVDILKSLDVIDFNVLFLTSHKEFAVEAFRYDAVDYILKPINSSHLKEALERARKRRKANSNLKIGNKRIIINTTDCIYSIKEEDIIRLKADDCYTEIYTIEHGKIVTSKVMKGYEELLKDNSAFMRIHRSHIINLYFFKQIEKEDGGSVLLKDGTRIPLSTAKKQDLIDRLNSLT